MGYNGAKLFLCAKAAEDKVKFEHTTDWEWRVNLHPATWLNQERWTDIPGPVVEKKNDKQSQLERILAKAREEDARNGIPYESD